MDEDLSKQLEVVIELAKEQADYIDRVGMLVKELWGGNYLYKRCKCMKIHTLGMNIGL
jgi:hypothetical protein